MENQVIIKGNPLVVDGYNVPQTSWQMVESMIKGETIMHWEFGDSLYPIVKSGEYVKIAPITSLDEIKVGDLVFCAIQYTNSSKIYMVHMVTAISTSHHSKQPFFKIGDTSYGTFGWTSEIYGKAVGTNIFHSD